MKIQLEEVSCNLCGSSRHRLRFEKWSQFLGHMFRIVECEVCGLVFVNPRLSAEQIRSLYDASYYRGEGFDCSIHYEEELESPTLKESATRRILERLMVANPPPADLLEVGPGMGHFLRSVKERGFRVVGLELSPYAASVLQKQGLEIVIGTLQDVKFPDDSFDVVVAVEVIEHLRDPKQFFGEVARILRPGGIFYYETGDINCESARRMGPGWHYIMPEGHLHYFSPRTLSRYLREAGFQVCYPLWFNAKRRLVRYLECVGLVDEANPVFRGMKGAVARLLFQAWDMPSSRRPYPMARRLR